MRAGSVLVLFLVLAVTAAAQEFPVFGARHLAMGRAGVASVNDLTAAYLNPAALATHRALQLRLPVGIGVFSPVDIDETQDIIDEITTADLSDPNTPAVIADALERLDDDLAVSSEAYAMIGAEVAEKLTFTFTSRAMADIFVVVDRINVSTVVTSPNFVGNNNTSGLGHILWLQEAGLTFATALPGLDENLTVGVTGIGGAATTYNETISILQETLKGDTIDWWDRIRSNKETSFFVDMNLGVQYRMFDRKVVLGIAGTQLASPRIDRKKASNLTLDPQVRVGVAWSPYLDESALDAPEEEAAGEKKPLSPTELLSKVNPLTITLDYDVTENESALALGLDTRYIGGGVEYVPASWVALRGGVYCNLAELDLGHTLTLGAQFHRFDLAGAYSTKSANGIANDVRLALGFALDF